MRLVAPNGVRVSVSEEKGEALIKKGYRRLPEDIPAANGPERPPARRKPKAK